MPVIRMVIATVVAAAAIVVVPGVAHACSCVPPPVPRKAVEQYDSVFAGTVVGIEDPQEGTRIVSSADPLHYTFEVDAVAKGPRTRTVEISSARSGASCGAEFREGRRYLVFAYYGSGFTRTKTSERLWSNLCTPNQKLAPGEALPIAAETIPPDEIMRPPIDPPEAEPGLPLGAVVGSITLIVLVGLVLLLRDRSARAR